MKQISQHKVQSRSVTVLLKKDNVGDYKDSVKLIEGISEKREFLLDGKVVDVKEYSFGELMKTTTSGVSGWHRFHEAFAQIHTVGTNQFEYPNGEQDIYETIDNAFGEGQNEQGEVYGTEMRKIQVGDIITVQEWGFEGVQVGNMRSFVVADVDFEEFSRATGEFL